MKFSFQILITLLITIICCTPQCPAASYCQSCLDSASTCNSCYSWGDSGTLQDKTWTASTGDLACSNDLPATYLVKNCQINNHISKATSWSGAVTTDLSNTSHPRCFICDNRPFLNFNSASSIESCSTIAAVATGLDCTQIANCEQTVCVNDSTNPGTYCALCQKGFYPAIGETQIGDGNWVGYKTLACSATILTAITSCERYFASGTYAAPGYGCYQCAKGYAVASDFQSCTAFATDENCRYLSSQGFCQECFAGYYFNMTVCQQQSYLIMLLPIALLFSFVQLV